MPSKLLIILNIITSIQSTAIPMKTCHRIQVSDKWYDQEILWANIGRPNNLNVHKATNTLFFSYSVPEMLHDVDFQLAYFNLNFRDNQIIAGVRGGCAIAIDQDHDEVYLGGSDGIFKYNMLTKIADEYKEKGKNVWSLFYKRNLFYVSYPNQTLHIEIDGKFSTVKEFEKFEIDNFFVAHNNDIYYSNKSGLYMYDNINMRPEVINELLSVRQITEDNEGKLYFCTNVGIFSDGKFDGLRKILDMKNVFGMTFDKDNNMIISDEDSIIRLKYNKIGCKDEHW